MELIEQRSVTDLKNVQDALSELKQMEKRNLSLNRIKMICMAVIAGMIVIAGTLMMISVRRFVKKTEEVAVSVKTASDNINAIAKDLNEIDYIDLGRKLQSIVDSADESMKTVGASAGNLEQLISDSKTTMERLKSLDIDGLNDGINTLNDILAPLAKFFNLIG